MYLEQVCTCWSLGPSEHEETGRGGGQVYVVHHDGGRAPVTVYHEDGTEVVELPPRYAGSSSGSGGTSSDRERERTRFDRSLSGGTSDGEGGGGGERTPDFLQQRRESRPTPKKATLGLRPVRRES